MRLLKYDNTNELSLTDELNHSLIPKYAILSHTWGAEEFTFKDLIEGTGKDKSGYQKVRLCGDQAKRDGLQYFWVDTCCIDKSSSAVLSEAIISMFNWYQKAAKCYVYLSDVGGKSDQLDRELAQSRWFTRGWTLQELLAPESVTFFSKHWEEIGDKMSLKRVIWGSTGIPTRALQPSNLSTFSVEERLKWAKERQTERPEDNAYSLLGIFDVSMPVLYGEGKEKAFNRLYDEIDKSSTNNSRIERRNTINDAPPNIYINIPQPTARRSIRRSSTNFGTYEVEPEIRCYRCDNRHWLKNCYANLDTVDQARRDRMNSGRCVNCGSPDHFKRECSWKDLRWKR